MDAKLSVGLIHADGRGEIVGPAPDAKPGDVLEYAVRYVNRGDTAAVALSPTLPIPPGTTFVPSEASPKPSHASLDGRTFAAIPLRRVVRDADGASRVVDIPAREYRALRWSVGDLAGGAEVTVRARVRIAVSSEAP